MSIKHEVDFDVGCRSAELSRANEVLQDQLEEAATANQVCFLLNKLDYSREFQFRFR